ncbi:hypothetical protein [Halovivax limisalsi]|uniref:hypothetical protein n=1 Tax=Halovivax limisalsi TaxID=1453760 RepID=UPI001FFDDDBF|nr:hypothetical protein [Halovivax limisalsi]
MNVPQPLRDPARRDIAVRTVDDDDRSAIIVDFGPDAGEGAVDVVGDTVLVVTEDGQFEFDLPPEASSVTERNGVVTIST